VRNGDLVPDFSLSRDNDRWLQYFNGAEIHGPAIHHQLHGKPLVISFYAAAWQKHGTTALRQLNALQQEVKLNGGNLLVITPDGSEHLSAVAWEQNLSLTFYLDQDNVLSRKFRVYSDEDPLWNKFSGIDANAPLLATYVISAYGRILFDYIESDFADEFPSKNIISSVYHAGVLRRVATLRAS